MTNRLRGRQRVIGPAHRPVKPIEIVTRRRPSIDLNLSFTSRHAPRVCEISLARVAGYFEEEPRHAESSDRALHH